MLYAHRLSYPVAATGSDPALVPLPPRLLDLLRPPRPQFQTSLKQSRDEKRPLWSLCVPASPLASRRTATALLTLSAPSATTARLSRRVCLTMGTS